MIALSDSVQATEQSPHLPRRRWILRAAACQPHRGLLEFLVLGLAFGVDLVAYARLFVFRELGHWKDPGVTSLFLDVLGKPAQLLQHLLAVWNQCRAGSERGCP